MSDGVLVLRNRLAVAGWAFMAIWIGVLCLFTWIAFVRDQSVPGLDPPAMAAVFGLFWLFGLGGLAHCVSTACITIVIRQGQVTVRERFPLRVADETFEVTRLAAPTVIETRDGDGEPYFRGELVTPSGRTIVFSEGNDEADVEAACARLLTFSNERLTGNSDD